MTARSFENAYIQGACLPIENSCTEPRGTTQQRTNAPLSQKFLHELENGISLARHQIPLLAFVTASTDGGTGFDVVGGKNVKLSTQTVLEV